MFDKASLIFNHAATPDGFSTGLVLDIQQCEDSIVFMFRNDDNIVYIGESYELFNFTDNGMVSLQQWADDERQSLWFNDVLVDLLFLSLYYHTKGRAERSFTDEDSKH